MDDYPLWAWREDGSELFYPVFGPEDFPDNSGDLCIRADFTTLGGMILKGYIAGIQNIFGIAIFWKNEILFE